MRGLGDLVAKAISIVTLGQGKKIATYIAKLRGKEDCGCDKRQDYLNRKFSFKPEEMKLTIIDWTESWHLIRQQVSCSCQFDYGYVEIKDKDHKFIAEARFDAPPMLNGQLKQLELGINPLMDPSYFEIRFHKTEGGYTEPVKVEMK